MSEVKMQRAIEAMKIGDKKGARHLLQSILKKDRDNVRAWAALFQIADYPEEAKTHLREILRLRPGNKWALERLAFLENGSKKKRRKGCLSPVVLGLVGILFVLCSITLIVNSTPEGGVVLVERPTPTPETYDEAFDRILIELGQDMLLAISLVRNPDFDPNNTIWGGDLRFANIGVVSAYSELSNLEPPPEREQEHIAIIQALSNCQHSAMWFDRALVEARQGNNFAYLESLDKGLGYFEQCNQEIELISSGL